MIEKPRGSEICSDADSLLHRLVESSLEHHVNKLDQCMHGAEMDDGSVRKATDIVSNHAIPEVVVKCDGSHKHVHLEGRNKNGSRTAQAAVFPDQFCKNLLNATQRIATIPSGGRSSIHVVNSGPITKTTEEVVTGLMSEVYTVAKN